ARREGLQYLRGLLPQIQIDYGFRWRDTGAVYDEVASRDLQLDWRGRCEIACVLPGRWPGGRYLNGQSSSFLRIASGKISFGGSQMSRALVSLSLLCAVCAGAQTYQPNWESLDRRSTPAWFTDAKFGIFIHW